MSYVDTHLRVTYAAEAGSVFDSIDDDMLSEQEPSVEKFS